MIHGGLVAFFTFAVFLYHRAVMTPAEIQYLLVQPWRIPLNLHLCRLYR